MTHRSSLGSRFFTLTAVVGFALAAAAPAQADDTGVWKALKGRIIVSDQELGAGYSSDGAMISGLKKANRSAIAGADGQWTLNMMVFLKEAAGTTRINIVYYPAGKTKIDDALNPTEIEVKADQRTIQLNGQTVSKEMSFEKGKKYEIRATKLVGGKEIVLAKTQVTLK